MEEVSSGRDNLSTEFYTGSGGGPSSTGMEGLSVTLDSGRKDRGMDMEE